jgi:hypothetical protein
MAAEFFEEYILALKNCCVFYKLNYLIFGLCGRTPNDAKAVILISIVPMVHPLSLYTNLDYVLYSSN